MITIIDNHCCYLYVKHAKLNMVFINHKMTIGNDL